MSGIDYALFVAPVLVLTFAGASLLIFLRVVRGTAPRPTSVGPTTRR